MCTNAFGLVRLCQMNELQTIGATVHQCLYNKVPQYLVDCWASASYIVSDYVLHVIASWLPLHRRSTLGCRAFSDAGPTPDHFRDWLYWACILKSFFFSQYLCIQRIRGVCDYALYKSTFYLLTFYCNRLSVAWCRLPVSLTLHGSRSCLEWRLKDNQRTLD